MGSSDEWVADTSIAIAIYNLDTSEPNVVSFKHGDLFQAQFSTTDWLYGKSFITGAKGLISKHHVFIFSKKEFPVEYECLTEKIRLEMMEALFQWTEKLKHKLSIESGWTTKDQKPTQQILEVLNIFKKYGSNEKLIFRGDMDTIYDKIDTLNKKFSLAKRFRDARGDCYDLGKVLSINVCEVGRRLIDTARIERSMSTEPNLNVLYRITINRKGTRFEVPKLGIQVPMFYVFALVDSETFEHLSEPFLIRNSSSKSHGFSSNESVEDEWTYSFTSEWLRKQLRQIGANESRMRVRSDLLENILIAGWAVTTSDDVREKRMERAAKSVDADPKLKEIPDVQIPMYAGTSYGAESFPDASSRDTNSRIQLSEVCLDVTGRVLDSAANASSGMRSGRSGSGSVVDDIATHSNRPVSEVIISFRSERSVNSVQRESRLSTNSNSDQQATHGSIDDGVIHGINDAPLPYFKSSTGVDTQKTRITVDILPSTVMESKSILKGQPQKFVFSSMSIGYASVKGSQDSVDIDQSNEPTIKFVPYANCASWHFTDSFESVVEVVPASTSANMYEVERTPFLNRGHIDIELENDEQARKWRKEMPYLCFELRRSKIATNNKNLLSKACLTNQVEHFKPVGYCVLPLFDEVLPRNGEYQLKVLSLVNLREVLDTKPPRKPGKPIVWPFTSWANDAYQRDESDIGRNAQCSLTVDFSLSSQILMNEAFVPQLINLPDTLKSLLVDKDFIQPHELDKSLSSIRDFLTQSESEREKNINVCLRFLKKMLESLFYCIVFIYNKLDDNQQILEILVELTIDLCWAVHKENSQSQEFISGSIAKYQSQFDSKLDLYKSRSDSLEKSLLLASGEIGPDSSMGIEGYQYLSIAFLTSLQYELEYSINRLKSESMDQDDYCMVDQAEESRNNNSSPFLGRSRFHTKLPVLNKVTRANAAKSIFGHQASSYDLQEQIDTSEKYTKNPIRTNEILELSHFFLKTSLVHFKSMKDKLKFEERENVVVKFEQVLTLLYKFLKLRKVEPFFETVAIGLIQIMDSICDLDDDVLIKETFNTLGKLMDASAHDNFPQRKNPCLLLLNKLHSAKDPKLWRLGVEFLAAEINKERIKLCTDEPSNTTYNAVVIILSKLVSYLSNDDNEAQRNAREVVLNSLFEVKGVESNENLLSWLFGNTVERCAGDRNNMDSARAYFGLVLSTMELISKCTPEETQRYLNTGSDRDIMSKASCWEIVETLLQLGRRVQDQKIGDMLMQEKNKSRKNKNSAKLLSPERRLPVISSSKFGRRLFDSDEYIFFKVKATNVMLTFIKHLISTCPPSSLKLDHLGVIVLELISQNFLQPRKFSQKNETICEDLVFPQTQQHFGDLRVKGIAIFRQIWELCLKTIPKNASSPVGKLTELPLQTDETNFTLVDFINFCCCDLVRLSVAMDYAITRPLCYVITEMIAEMPQLCEQHVISTLIQFDLQRNLTDSEVRVRKYFYDRINSGGFPKEKKKKVDEMKSRLQTLLDAQQLNIKSGDSDDRASFLAITLRLSYLIKFYSAQDQSQYRMFKDLYLRQMIKTLSEPDLGGGSSFDQQDPAGFYRAEIAQCYLSLASLCESERKTSRSQREEQPKDDSIEKLELLEQAAINFQQAGRLVQAEKIFHEIEEAYRSKWLLKRLQAIRSKLDQLYNRIVGETLDDLTAISAGQPEWFYYVRLYGNLPSAVEDSGFIIRVPTSVEVSEAAREITRIFPDIQRQNIGTDPHTAKLDPGEAYFQISLTEVKNSDSAKEKLQIRKSQLKSVGLTSLGSPTSAYKAAKLVSSKFYSTLKPESDVDETLTSFENVITSLNAKSETSTFSTKWVQPHDQKLEEKIVRQIMTVKPALPSISPWNSIAHTEQKVESGLVLAMDFISESIKSLNEGIEEVGKKGNYSDINRHKGVFQSIICSPVSGGVQSYYAIADDSYVSKFDQKEVEKMRKMCSTLVDKLIKFMEIMESFFSSGEKSIFLEYMFDVRCLFKHASLQFDTHKTDLAYWLICQKQKVRKLDLPQVDLATFKMKDKRKQAKLLNQLAEFLVDVFIDGFSNFVELSEMCKGVKKFFQPNSNPSVTAEEMLWDSMVIILSRFDIEVREFGEKNNFVEAFREHYLEMLQYEDSTTKDTIKSNLKSVIYASFY